MRVLSLLGFLALLFTAVAAWDKQDHEIFDLVSAIEASEGKGTTFYSWLNVPPTASTGEIAKAYRKLSMQLHPDKNPENKKIAERFARLGVVSTILRNQESRERYDFFYKNGVPKWRGTGYYYSRFRPGLGTALAFLTLVSSGLQYVIQSMTYRSDLARVQRFMNEARVAAWGPKLVPLQGQKKVKVNIGGPRRMDEDGNIIPGRVIDMVVDGDEVYILEPSGEMHLLDTSAAIPPSIARLWPIALMRRIYSRIKKPSDAWIEQESESTSDDEAASATSGSEAQGSRPATPSARGPVAKTAGGRRRKASRRK